MLVYELLTFLELTGFSLAALGAESAACHSKSEQLKQLTAKELHDTLFSYELITDKPFEKRREDTLRRPRMMYLVSLLRAPTQPRDNIRTRCPPLADSLPSVLRLAYSASMSTSPVPQAKPAKIPREMSNHVVKLVLERSDDLIKNSYRRLTTENVARNEHWQKIAEMVAARFGQPVDADRIKQHFHNRKKVLIARIKDEMRTFQTGLNTDEKIEELLRRRVFGGDHDEQLARICLDMEDEEKKNEPENQSSYNAFGEASHHSLLSQLLSSTTIPDCNASLAGSSRESEQPTHHPTPLLSKLLLGQTSRDDAIYNNNNYLSHLIVDLTSPNELKRLLSVLIDHGFSRFTHVDSLSQVAARHSSNLTNGHAAQNFDSIFDKDDDVMLWNGTSGLQTNEETVSGEIDVQAISDRVERVDVEVKAETSVDEHEAMLADVQKKSMALFERKSPDLTAPPSAKRIRNNGTVDAPTVPCEMCNSVIRLNTGGSKWNLFEHVVLKHSDHRPFKCSQCPYEAARKIRIRQHASSLHGTDAEPVDNVTPQIRKEWSEKMAICFPSHQYGKQYAEATS
ncbi:unnamed protein product [Caenorhabditis auriculariae]|uniref:C2H2-type domain-containing protein n=1 Tax=Caenorhabditis auriculariae TaxID=2777116 RepID=A0A8S1HBC7_9PELO|nr:unnamed protein product [Caenorhabditis auriculariae]